MKLMALDLSLTGTGWAGANPLAFGTFKFGKPDDPMARLFEIRRLAMEKCSDAELVLIEGPAFAMNDPGSQERSGLAYLIRMALWEKNIPVLLPAPNQLKKFAAGSGAAKKEMVIKEVFRNWGYEAADNNQADAIALALIGKCLVGEVQPLNDSQREVIAALRQSNPWLKRFSANTEAA